MNIHTNDIVQVMVGQFKAPLSQEEQQSSKYYGFVERSMLNNLAPGRSPGMMVHGHTENNVLGVTLILTPIIANCVSARHCRES